MADVECQHDEAAAEQQLVSDIEKYGCHIILILGDDYLPSFVYSVGLTKTYGHPEIICFDLPREVLFSVVDMAHELIKTGRALKPGQSYDDFLEGYDVQFVPVNNEYYPDYLSYARWFYGSNEAFETLQLVWPDKQHRFPWDEGFNPNWRLKQPLLDRNTDFKFYEERDLGVFVTQAVLDGQPILTVEHDDEGDWLFWGEDRPTADNMKLVCLEELVKRDPTLNDLHQLRPGWWAWRDQPEETWHTEKVQLDECGD
ncbi:DUF4262 domain-containing protein [Hymenobacter sp. 15J16-1T3B]|uniref:DUF4262 domain-containing protein n=1 Tax=Hymenobacter sp. 15J16-1T3B TaxID=2886941 RepID=UPI001D1029F7|nr:DUF4262 domain-containing protein [Hymenobacter sp. 15J16-1T3B]MCC3160272.1 DUF4262 domain-containing protein [Hymenobacter sp. 15J16-1T3B]